MPPAVEITKRQEVVNDVPGNIRYRIKVVQRPARDMHNEYAEIMHSLSTDELLALKEALSNIEIK